MTDYLNYAFSNLKGLTAPHLIGATLASTPGGYAALIVLGDTNISKTTHEEIMQGYSTTMVYKACLQSSAKIVLGVLSTTSLSLKSYNILSKNIGLEPITAEQLRIVTQNFKDLANSPTIIIKPAILSLLLTAIIIKTPGMISKYLHDNIAEENKIDVSGFLGSKTCDSDSNLPKENKIDITYSTTYHSDSNLPQGNNVNMVGSTALHSEAYFILEE
jgi:hypothetical protein